MKSEVRSSLKYLDEEELESEEELEDEDEAEEALFLVLGGILPLGTSCCNATSYISCFLLYMLSIGPEKAIDLIDLRIQTQPSPLLQCFQ